MSKVYHTSKSDEWSTPEWLWHELNEEFRFSLDPCATKKNAKCGGFGEYYTKENCGLSNPWKWTAFVNPPYSQVAKWIAKGHEEIKNGNCAIAVFLVGARTDTKWFHEIVLANNYEVRFVRGRLKFGGSKNSAPFPSMIVVMRNTSTYWGKGK